jgi:CubicO group peptidase (beta-lactamase class C family)
MTAKRIMRGIFVIMIAAGAFGLPIPHGAHVANAEPSSDDASAADLRGDPATRSQHVIDQSLKPDQPGCSAAIGKDGQVVWTGVRGLANLSNKTPITQDTVMDIASTSKQFTATAVLLLADDGKLALSDTLSEFVVGLPAWANAVTVIQLIHHQTGIPDYDELLTDAGFDYGDPTTQQQALDALAKVKALNFAPGSGFEYSNSNYILLAEIVRNVTGQSLPVYLAQYVFAPLDLRMVMDPVTTVRLKATSYEAGPLGPVVADSRWEQIGDGAVQTTPSELARWGDNYRTGRVGGPTLLTAQLANAVPTDDPTQQYGAAIFLLPDGSLEHSGSWAGFRTEFRVSTDRHTVLAVSCNSSDVDRDGISNKLWHIWTTD